MCSKATEPWQPNTGFVIYEFQNSLLLRSQMTPYKSISLITKMKMSVCFISLQMCSVNNRIKNTIIGLIMDLLKRVWV